MIKILAPIEPQPFVRASSKGRRRFNPPRYREFKDHLGFLARQQMRGEPPLTGKLKINIVVSRSMEPEALNYGDWDNHAKAISDALNGIVYVDDRQIVKGSIELLEGPGYIEVEIEELPTTSVADLKLAPLVNNAGGSIPLNLDIDPVSFKLDRAKLRDLIIKRKLSQTELASLSDLDPSEISLLLRGRANPRPSTLQSLAKALGVKGEDLLLDKQMNSPVSFKVDREKLRACMIKRNLSRSELAHRAGIDRGVVRRTLRGQSNLRLGTLGKIAKALGIKGEDLLDERTWANDGIHSQPRRDLYKDEGPARHKNRIDRQQELWQAPGVREQYSVENFYV